MISAINPTTKKMPHTIPALNIPFTTEQLPKQKAKKQTSEKRNNLILRIVSQIAYLFFNSIKFPKTAVLIAINGECILHSIAGKFK